LHHLTPSVADPGKLAVNEYARNHMRVVQLFEFVNNLY
jgi:hypothetical protein